LLTRTDSVLNPPQPLNWDISALAWPLGVLPLNTGPDRASFLTPPVWQPDGVGAGGPVTVSENVPVAVPPLASATVTWKVDVPIVVGAPRSRPDGRSVRPDGGRPLHAYGAVPPLARNVVVKKLLPNTLLPAPMSHTPLLQVKNRVSIDSGAVSPAPAPVIGADCGLLAALSVTMNVAERLPPDVGENVMETLQLAPAPTVVPEHPSLTWVKSRALVPRVWALLMNSPDPPVLVTDIDCGALVVPTAWAGKVSDDGVSVTAGGEDAGCDGVQPERFVLADVAPSLTVI
jgi:hypothetical protein